MKNKDVLKNLGKVVINADMMDIIPGGVIGISALGQNFLFASDGLFSLTGYTRKEFVDTVSKDWFQILFHPDDKKRVEVESFEQLKKNGRIAIEFRLIHKNGNHIWLKLYAGFVSDPIWGLYIQGIFLDNTMSKQNAIEAERIRQRIDCLINTVPGGVAEVTLSNNFHIGLASEGYFRMTGYTREEFLKEPIRNNGGELVLADDLPLIQNIARQLIETGEPNCVEYRIKKKDGTIAWNTAYLSGALKRENQYITQGVFIDTTNNKNIEHRLLNLTNSIPGGVAHIQANKGLMVEYASNGFYRLTGYSMEEFTLGSIYADFSKLIYSPDKEMVLKSIRSARYSEDENYSLEYRICHQNGSICWIRMSYTLMGSLNSNNISLECIFLDITESKKIQVQMEVNEERYRIISEQAQDIIFDCDLENNSIFVSPVFQKKLGTTLDAKNAWNSLMTSSLVHDDDKERLLAFGGSLKKGCSPLESEFRLKNYNRDEYIWCKITATVIFGDMKKPIRAVGMITDINSYKKENASWKEKASRDLLTGLLNKITIQENIEERLANSNTKQKHAFFLVDIDNFKGINDNLGHAMGDAILTEISSRISEHFRETDLIGRIGGDEFAIFMENATSNDVVQQKAEVLCSILRRTFQTNGKVHQISGSIGAAIYPEDGKTFKELYSHADDAMYYSKKHGKDCFSLCKDLEEINSEGNIARRDNIIESEGYLNVDFAMLIFEILYDSPGIDSAINMVLELVARYYKIGRICIYEILQPSQEWQRTFHYKANDESEDMIKINEITDKFDEYTNEKGIFYCNDINNLNSPLRDFFAQRQIFTVLLIPMIENGTKRGYIGYSESPPGRQWKNDEIEICSLIGKIIGTFLTRRNAWSDLKEKQTDIKKEGVNDNA